ncbi:hypothetical protein [Aestuariirhabdus sp. LZHN29]|uniref:hypothetical protein n=1 Tax=Aestuariirhabdus sp. LZHN29 TaxID=3417462 RepID=UPI003CEDD48F
MADNSQYNHYRAEVLRFLHERHSRTEEPRVVIDNPTPVEMELPPKGKSAA